MGDYKISQFFPWFNWGGANPDNNVNSGPVAGPASMLARGEFRGVPWSMANPGFNYQQFGYNDFIGPDDIRLKQISRFAAEQQISVNENLKQIINNYEYQAIEIQGRAKKPTSIYGKLFEDRAKGQTIGGIKDLSGNRINIDVSLNENVQINQLQGMLKERYSKLITNEKDYLNFINDSGYRGRIHSIIKGEHIPNFEVQIGTKDLTSYIDHMFKTSGGDARTLHDLRGFKGEYYGWSLSPEMQGRYTSLIGKIAENNKQGFNLSQNRKLFNEIELFKKDVESVLPENFPEVPLPKLSAANKVRYVLGRGVGILGVAGGAFDLRQGAGEFENGKYLDGTAHLGIGSANVFSGATLLLGRTALGVGSGGIAAAFEGGYDIVKGARAGDYEQMAVGGGKGFSGSLMLYGVATANPIVIGAGAIGYAGSVFYENRGALYDAASSATSWVGDQISSIF